jgi:hypothetical protein
MDVVSFAHAGGVFVLVFQDNGVGGSREGETTMALLAREFLRE